jgi:hypothetical protein
VGEHDVFHVVIIGNTNQDRNGASVLGHDDRPGLARTGKRMLLVGGSVVFGQPVTGGVQEGLGIRKQLFDRQQLHAQTSAAFASSRSRLDIDDEPFVFYILPEWTGGPLVL